MAPTQEIMRQTRFPSLEKLVTIRRWTFLDTCVTFTGSLGWCRWLPCAATQETPVPSSFLCAVAEKNDLWPVRARASQLLRSACASDSRPVLWRQARLPFGECTPGGLLALRRGEDR